MRTSDEHEIKSITPGRSSRNAVHLVAYVAARAALLLLRVIPRTIGAAFVDVLATAAWHVDFRHRHIARVNLRIAFPGLGQPERDRIGRASFRNTARNLLEIANLGRWRPGNVSQVASYDPSEGLRNFEEARARGRAILYMTGHFSAWELLPAVHALNGHPLSFVTRPLDNPYLNRFVQASRTSGGNTVISKWKSVRRILESLKKGNDVGILMDQNTRVQEGTFADLFGVAAATTTSVALLALRTDATVLPGFIVPHTRLRYRIKFLPPVELHRTGDLESDVRRNTQILNGVLEEFIRGHPQAWLWGHKRWKYQPQGNPTDLYALSSQELDEFLARRSQTACSSEPPGS